MITPKRFEWASFVRDFGLLALGLASGAPTVLLALWFYLTGREQSHSGILTVLMVCTVFAAWGQWWKERKAHQIEKARIIADHEEKLSAKSRDWNGDWLSLENRFRTFDGPILATCYVCDGEESWRLETGDFPNEPHPEIMEFRELCALGVALLRTSPGVPSPFSVMSRSTPDDHTIWLKFVHDLYKPWKHVISQNEIRNGKRTDATLTQLEDLKKFSAMACQHCAGKSLL